MNSVYICGDILKFLSAYDLIGCALMPCCFYRKISSLISISGLITLTCGSAFANDDVHYWFSKNFEEKIDPSYNIGFSDDQTDVSRRKEELPLIVDLGGVKVRRSSFIVGGDVNVCFDNRVMHEARYFQHMQREKYSSRRDKGVKIDGELIRYCENYDLATGIGYYKHPNREKTHEITRGLLISRNLLGKPTCEAIFTPMSLYSLLSYRDRPNVPASRMYMDPYPGDFFFERAEHKQAFDDYLYPGDFIFTRPTVGGWQTPASFSLDKTWACLAPAFRLYWSEAFSQCKSGVQAMSADASIDELYIPVLEQLQSRMIEMAEVCRVDHADKPISSATD